MKSVRWMLSYILVASLGLWLAFAVSMKFMAPARSQQAPSSGELPPEFLKEVEATQVPTKEAPTTKPVSGVQEKVPTSGGAQAPKPSANSGGVKAQVPPPPAGSEAASFGDAVTAASSYGDVIQKDEYVYDPTGKRDPFKPFRIMRPQAKADKVDFVQDPLQRWEVDRLKIVGILWDVKHPRAMVKDPDGAVYTIMKSSKIGRNDGVVTAIREGEIVIVETKHDEGKLTKETRVLELKK